MVATTIDDFNNLYSCSTQNITSYSNRSHKHKVFIFSLNAATNISRNQSGQTSSGQVNRLNKPVTRLDRWKLLGARKRRL